MIAVVKLFNPKKMNDMLTIQRAAAEKRLTHEESEEFKKKKEKYEESEEYNKGKEKQEEQKEGQEDLKKNEGQNLD